MRVAVVVYKSDDTVPFRKFAVGPETDYELKETSEDIAAFLRECQVEIEEEYLYGNFINE